MRLSVAPQGLTQARLFADALPEATAREAAKVVRSTVLDVEARAKQMCPVDTGWLRSTIGTTFGEGGLLGYVGAYAHYAQHVHYGANGRKGVPFIGKPFAEAVKRAQPKLEAILNA